MVKLIRAATVPTSLATFLEGNLEELQKCFDLVLLSSPGEELAALHAQHGIRTIAVPMERGISPLRDAVALLRLWRLFCRERPHMVHSMTPKAGLLCMAAAFLARVPRRVHSFTGLVWPTARGLRRRLLMLTDWITCACATHILPEGRGVMHDLQTHITRKPMRVLGYGNVRGVDLRYFCPANAPAELVQKQRRDDCVTFLFVGRLVGDKGLRELLAAFRRLQEQHPEARLVLVGHPEPEQDPLDAVTRRALATTPRVDIAGEVRGRNLLAYYAAADVLVLPSYREGFPNVVLEAGAMELPCIVTDVNGSREIIEHELNGLIVPPHQVAPLHAAMERLLCDSGLRAHLASRARPAISSRFEQGFVRQCLLNFYRDILS